MIPTHKEICEKILAGASDAMDKLILERMAINVPLVISKNGKVKHVSAFTLAEERWGKDFVKQWRLTNKKK